ncbi:MAG: histidine kinase [Schaedlerella sp.]|nr:histidine kinase [Schaedlerella sp.]
MFRRIYEKLFKDKLVFQAVCIGSLCFLLLLGLTTLFQLQINKEKQLRMEHIFLGLESEIYETLQVQMAKLQVMEGHLIETGGDFETFGPIAERMLNDEAIRSFLFAPDGIVEGAFPLEGNEPVIGLDMNTEGAGNIEAQDAIETGNLILAGPFEMVEGGIGVCGRLPIYLENEQGGREYWGLVTVTLNHPEIFADSAINRVNEQGYACRIWRVNPDDGQEQTILETERTFGRNTKIVDYEASLFNTTWMFSFAPLEAWYLRASLWICVLGSFIASFLLAYGVYSSKKIKYMEAVEAELRISNLQQKLEQEQTRHLLSQISSHFFYHTLNALQTLILIKPEMAVKMSADFARYLRFNVNTSINAKGIVNFEDEIRAVRAYAEINEVQLGDRLQVIFDIPDVSFKIPALTIEPIVENAIIHGIKPKIEGGIVSVRLQEDETHWHVTVQDNGMGFDVDEKMKEQSIGLSNVCKRIHQFEGCEIKIDSAKGEGTTIVLSFTKILNVCDQQGAECTNSERYV